MQRAEHVSLASLTTFHTGGTARYVLSCDSTDALREALAFARSQALPYRVLGEGSNVLAADTGFEGVIIRLTDTTSTYSEEGETVLVTAAAGVHWDTLVRDVAQRGLWGLENLAGIPGTVGAAPVQNIGAYGSEVRDTLDSVQVLTRETDTLHTYTNTECAFGYRDSRFKYSNDIILSVTFRLAKEARPQLTYADFVRYVEEGGDTSTPEAIGNAVRAIRARKFPDIAKEGTAGSFFKNPIVTSEVYAMLTATYPELPGFDTSTGIKIPLAFVLDKILALRGYRVGNVRLFEQQPLVVVADSNATTDEIDAFATTIQEKIFATTTITVEREVQFFPKK